MEHNHDVLYDGRCCQTQSLGAVAWGLAGSIASGDRDGIGPAGRIRRSRHGQSGIDRGVVSDKPQQKSAQHTQGLPEMEFSVKRSAVSGDVDPVIFLQPGRTGLDAGSSLPKGN